jgi:hypothetical protein
LFFAFLLAAQLTLSLRIFNLQTDPALVGLYGWSLPLLPLILLTHSAVLPFIWLLGTYGALLSVIFNGQNTLFFKINELWLGQTDVVAVTFLAVLVYGAEIFYKDGLIGLKHAARGMIVFVIALQTILTDLTSDTIHFNRLLTLQSGQILTALTVVGTLVLFMEERKLGRFDVLPAALSLLVIGHIVPLGFTVSVFMAVLWAADAYENDRMTLMSVLFGFVGVRLYFLYEEYARSVLSTGFYLIGAGALLAVLATGWSALCAVLKKKKRLSDL